MQKSIKFYRNQFLLSLASIPLGAAIGAVCSLFGVVLSKVTGFKSNHYLWLLPFLGIAGAFIVWCYNRFGKDSAKGMSLFFEVHQDIRKEIPLRLVPFVMVGTWLTHLFGGSAGREGAAVQMGGTIGHYVGDKLRVPDADKILMISGMAAGFGGLFRTPIAAVFFALEVFRRGSIQYSALLPAFASAYTACFVSGLFGIEKFSRILPPGIELNLPVALKLIALGVIFSLAGVLFSVLLKKVKALLTGYLKNPIMRVLVCGTIIGLLSMVCFQGRYSGLGENLILASFSNDIMPWDFALKILFTVFTLAVGFTGGEFTPLFSIGASAGFVLAAVFGLPAELCAALGYIGVFTGATNTFFAPIFISYEIFGPQYIPMFIIVCALSYICNGGKSIYSLQK